MLYYGSKKTKEIDKVIQTYLIENEIPFIYVIFDDKDFFIKYDDGHFSKLANIHLVNKIKQYMKID